MVQVSITLDKAALEAAKRKLGAARDAVKNSSPMMRQVAVYLDQWVQRNFQSGGGKVGTWQPFTYGGRLAVNKPYSRGGTYPGRRPTKANSKSGDRYINTSARLLMDTGHLRLSFLPFVRVGVAGIGSDLPYSKPHEEGDGVPQRRLLPKQSEVESDVNQIMGNFIVMRMNNA